MRRRGAVCRDRQRSVRPAIPDRSSVRSASASTWSGQRDRTWKSSASSRTPCTRRCARRRPNRVCRPSSTAVARHVRDPRAGRDRDGRVSHSRRSAPEAGRTAAAHSHPGRSAGAAWCSNACLPGSPSSLDRWRWRWRRSVSMGSPYWVTSRTREIGVRVALGARSIRSSAGSWRRCAWSPSAW